MPNPFKKLAIDAVVNGGCSLADAGREADVSRATVSRWVREHLKTAAREAERVASETSPGDRAAPIAYKAAADMLDETRRMHEYFMRASHEARDVGNYSAAQRFARDAAQLVPTIARLEKARKEDGDRLQFSRHEIDEAVAGLLDKVRILSERPLLCAHCSRRLSMSLAGVREKRGSDEHERINED